MLKRYGVMCGSMLLVVGALRLYAASPSPAPAPSPSAKASPSPALVEAPLTNLRLERAGVAFPCPHPRQVPRTWGDSGMPTEYTEESQCRAGTQAKDWRPGSDVAYQLVADGPAGPVKLQVVYFLHEVAK